MRRLVLVLAAAFLTSSGWASTTYTFTGTDYTSLSNLTNCTTGPCMNFTTSMTPSGSFTLAAPLGANFVSMDITGRLTAYSFSDGINTYTNTDPNSRIDQFEVSTDASGNINNATIHLQKWQSGVSPHSSGDRFALLDIFGIDVAVNNSLCNGPGTSFASGVPDVCVNGVEDSSTSAAETGVSGTWMLSVPTPTLGEWETILLGGLLVTFALLRLRHQTRGKPAA